MWDVWTMICLPLPIARHSQVGSLHYLNNFTAAAVPGIADELTLSGDDKSSAQEAFNDQPHPTAA